MKQEKSLIKLLQLLLPVAYLNASEGESCTIKNINAFIFFILTAELYSTASLKTKTKLNFISVLTAEQAKDTVRVKNHKRLKLKIMLNSIPVEKNRKEVKKRLEIFYIKKNTVSNGYKLSQKHLDTDIKMQMLKRYWSLITSKTFKH
jgi:hypothetical protein